MKLRTQTRPPHHEASHAASVQQKQDERDLAGPDVESAITAGIPRRGVSRTYRNLGLGIVPAGDLIALSVAAILVAPSVGVGLGYVVCAVLVGAAQGAYSWRIASSLQDAASKVLAQGAIALLPLAFIVSVHDADDFLFVPVMSIAALFFGRALTYGTVRNLRRRGHLHERTLLLGAGHQAVVLADVLRNHPEYGLKPIGFLDEFDENLDPPILGTIDDLEQVLEREAVDRIIVVYGSARDPDLVPLLRACDSYRIEVYVVPRFFELSVAHSSDTEEVWGIPLVRLRRPAMRRYARRTKRAFDVCVAGTGLVLAAPVMALCAALVKMSSPGPILFRQKRIGLNGLVIEVLKFRTMQVSDDSDTKWNVDNDSRVTRIGWVLRRTGLDELPQLVNVLRGEMSIVGPRPERPHFVEQFEASIPRYADRNRLPGGITGWAQVHQLRGDTSIEERSRFDNYYIEHWSLWRDIVIGFRTIATLKRHRR